MSKSYDRNIDRLRANQSAISKQEQGITTAAAKQRGDAGIEHARDIATKLTPFSTALQEWKDKDIKKKIEEGRAERDKAKLENAKWMEKNGTKYQQNLIAIEKAKAAGELLSDFEDLAAQDDYYIALKTEMLKRDGVKAYPDADRLAKLSPWQQVGFVQESIKQKKAALPDMVAHAMQNSTEEMTLGGITFTPKEIAENGLAFPMKEHALELITDKVYKNLGLNKYSEEMLELAKVPQAVRTAKENTLAKYRERYNIESSINTIAQSKLAFNRSEKNGKDIQKLLNTIASCVDTKNVLLDKSGAWSQIDQMIVSEGIRTGNTELAEKLLGVPMPDSMCRELGVPYGTTFAKHWKNKIPQLRQKIRKGISDGVREEQTILESENIALGNKFDELKRKGPIDEATLNVFKEKSSLLGGTLDSRIKNYETVSARNEREDVDKLEAIVASNNGFISHEQLNEFHPIAALKYREAATRHEKALKQKHNVDGLIKGALNASWHDAGIKSKEKPVVWEYALSNAREDYERKFNLLVSMGYDAAPASKLALHAPLGSVVDENQKPIPEFEGVIAEIQRNQAGSIYTTQSERQKESIKNSKLRVFEISQGKIEMQKNTLAGMEFKDYIIGNQYGKDRINEIIENIKIYGTWNGIRKSTEALEYYEGLSLGKRKLHAYGLIDQQLKAAGHPGIWPDRVEEEDDSGQVEAATSAYAPLNNGGSAIAFNQVDDNEEDLLRFYRGDSSIHNKPENMAPHLVA